MPGYGLLAADEGTGLLPWSWALERLRDSRNYWLSTVLPSGRPHTMPIWALWDEGTLWFSSGLYSRKIRNIQAGSDVSIAAEDALSPVVLEGTAQIVTDGSALRWFLDTLNAKYGTELELKHVDPTTNATVQVSPRSVFGLKEGDMGGSPTKWTFD
jgi:nitroimidazol reductase NimA-like FMN-containing flavoprotein (pyridoxamine 5'-phosphate oxidase superfamily)